MDGDHPLRHTVPRDVNSLSSVTKDIVTSACHKEKVPTHPLGFLLGGQGTFCHLPYSPQEIIPTLTTNHCVLSSLVLGSVPTHQDKNTWMTATPSLFRAWIVLSPCP